MTFAMIAGYDVEPVGSLSSRTDPHPPRLYCGHCGDGDGSLGGRRQISERNLQWAENRGTKRLCKL